MIALKKVLYPTDFSEYAAHALPYVLEFAKKFGAEVIVTHVLAFPAYAGSYEIAVDMETIRGTMEKAARQKMDELEKSIAAEGVAVKGIIEEGVGFVKIIDTARKESADIIIVATHGWGVLKHVLLGSTTEKLVRKAPCPVLTIRHPEHEFVLP
jgi:nucleotide-binding universal stress UspA family protein